MYKRRLSLFLHSTIANVFSLLGYYVPFVQDTHHTVQWLMPFSRNYY